MVSVIANSPQARFPEGTRAKCSGHLLPRMRRPSFSLRGDRTDLLRKTRGAIDGHGPIAGINTSFRGGWKMWWKDNTPHSRSRSLQPKRPALKMTSGAERALPMSTKGFQTPSLRRRAQGNHGASGLVPPLRGERSQEPALWAAEWVRRRRSKSLRAT